MALIFSSAQLRALDTIISLAVKKQAEDNLSDVVTFAFRRSGISKTVLRTLANQGLFLEPYCIGDIAAITVSVDMLKYFMGQAKNLESKANQEIKP